MIRMGEIQLNKTIQSNLLDNKFIIYQQYGINKIIQNALIRIWFVIQTGDRSSLGWLNYYVQFWPPQLKKGSGICSENKES